MNRDLHQLTIENGLTDNMVSCIYKDKDGFMWFGTNNGLSRYDGSGFRNFTIDVSGMNVLKIAELSQHCLGIIVEDSLCVFNRLSEKFIPAISTDKTIKSSKFHVYKPGHCISIKKNLLSFYKIEEERDKENHVVAIKANREKFEKIAGENEIITGFCFSSDSSEIIYLITDRLNLIVYNLNTGETEQRIKLYDKDVLVNASSILDADGFIWVSTIGEGMIRYNKKTGTTSHLSYGGKGQNNLISHPDVYNIIPINNGNLLAVTWNGYMILTPEKGDLTKLKISIYNNTSLVNRNLETRMISAYYDSQGILWIGTHGGGVMYSNLRLQFFNQYHQDRHNEICGITSDEKGYVWLATFHKGIMRSTMPFDPLGDIEFESFADKANHTETVLCLLKDRKGTLWFGNKNGTLTTYDGKNFKTYTINLGSAVNKSSVWSLFIDSKDNFWIGTDEGLLLFKPTSLHAEQIPPPYQSSPSPFSIRAITESKDGKIWIGTLYHGIRIMTGNKVSTSEYIFPNKNNISVRSLLASSDGKLYIGYDNGFAILNPLTEKIEEYFTTHNGLCNNYIGCIVEDSKGQIWLGTNSCISRYSHHQEIFYNYYISGSNRSAFLYGKNLLWGNNKTFTTFNPESINDFHLSKKVVFTELEVDNKYVKIGELINGQVILHNSIFFTKKIELNSDNRNFSINFNNFSYSPEDQKYRYRLYPYQEKWIITDKNEKISYANLPAGTYLFEVQSLCPDEEIGELSTLEIEILPHWNETLLFKLFILFLLIMFALWVWYSIRIKQKRLVNELQLKQEVFTAKMERKKEKQIRVERENFFTNAAHELRTPLTLIISPLQEIMYNMKQSDDIYKKLSPIYKQCNSLHTLVDHLLYVQKIEAGMIRLHLSEADIVGLVQDIAQSFQQIAEVKKIEYRVSIPDSPVLLWMDKEKIASAVQNLLSNAFKYTPEGKSITLAMERIEIDQKWFCKIAVSDTGKGIPNKHQSVIFDSFITGDTVPNLSTKVGIGLRIVKNTMNLHHGSVELKSQENEGCIFTLIIPEGKEHFANDNYKIDHDNIPHKNEDEEIIIVEEKDKANVESKKRTLLIIEDNKEIRKYIARLFGKDYMILEAEDGAEGLQKASQNLPDIIISDIMMPVKDGFECCREIRQQPSTTHIPILMLSAKNEDADILHASCIGVDDFMMKPFNPDILRSKVENLITQRIRLKRIYTKVLMQKEYKTDDDSNSELPDEFIKKLVQIIEANIANEELNVKMLAESLNMSQPTLYRKLKQRTHLAAIDIIRSVRMSKADSLITEERYSIQEIAEMVGYNDIRTLRKHFMSQFGVSPSKFIRD